MLITSFGYSVDLHFCKDQLKSLSIIGEAKSCHEKMTKCPRHTQFNTQNDDGNDCCSNKTIQIEDLDEDFTFTSLDLTKNNHLEIPSAFAPSLGSMAIANKCTIPPFKILDKLIPPGDTYALSQNFLL